MARLQDKDVADALATLENEFHSMEQIIEVKDNTIYALEQAVEALQDEVSTLSNKVDELEEALAEAYLTSERDVGD